MYDLSIILPTCNRAALLEKAIRSIAATTKCDYEIIVVDGNSQDGTAGVLMGAAQRMGSRLKVIQEEKREGFVKAANKGFRAATGRNLTWLNDDARPMGDSLDMAVQQINHAEADVGLVAMFHHWHSRWNVAYETIVNNRSYQLCHVRGTLYANFPVGARATFERVGYFDEQFYFNGADPDLSLKIWNAGLRVVPAFGAVIDHDEIDDPRRATDNNRASEDNAHLFAKWDLPPRDPTRNMFDAARPCTLRGLAHQVAAA